MHTIIYVPIFSYSFHLVNNTPVKVIRNDDGFVNILEHIEYIKS